MLTVRRQPGFVLLLVLVLLALAGTALATVSRRVMHQSLAALAAQEELQHRWGGLSCQRVLLPQAELLLQDAEAEQDVGLGLDSHAPRSVRRSVQLGDTTFHLIFADEQAKPNLNALHDRLGRTGSEQVVNHLARRSGIHAPVNLRPMPEALRSLQDDPRSQFQPYETLDQVFHIDGQPQAIVGTVSRQGLLREAAPEPPVTLWSDGRLNFRRAARLDLEAVTDDLLDAGQLDEMIRLRSELPGLGLSMVLEQLDLLQKEQAALQLRLTSRSACHSLWIIAESRQRRHCHLFIMQQTQEQPSQFLSFHW